VSGNRQETNKGKEKMRITVRQLKRLIREAVSSSAFKLGDRVFVYGVRELNGEDGGHGTIIKVLSPTKYRVELDEETRSDESSILDVDANFLELLEPALARGEKIINKRFGTWRSDGEY